MLVRMWEKRNTSTPLVGIEIPANTVKSSMEVPQKIKTRTTYNSVISLLGIYPQECVPGYYKATSTPMFI
jgi:hypothetical protein